jgi:hypothetical protein
MEANYERDKAMLERERQPALARSASHEVGHAEGDVYGNEDDDNKQACRTLGKLIKDELQGQDL